ncbi:hypothetical protein OIU74_026965 [Salix koriyanagi]|uniref:Uncharacterized protein n=1 Tax=Salix koriyanagi TaxID=2511006 RepID=A0A9Q1A4P3_9ROSI|nr:hypothetical protein OIU74_026965 [Salix koriyanagi]
MFLIQPPMQNKWRKNYLVILSLMCYKQTFSAVLTLMNQHPSRMFPCPRVSSPSCYLDVFQSISELFSLNLYEQLIHFLLLQCGEPASGLQM